MSVTCFAKNQPLYAAWPGTVVVTILTDITGNAIITASGAVILIP